jgi:hypothetical protein
MLRTRRKDKNVVKERYLCISTTWPVVSADKSAPIAIRSPSMAIVVSSARDRPITSSPGS